MIRNETYIPNGAVIWARQIIESDIFYKKPPEWFKIWFYIVQKVNHRATKHFKRGEGYFNFQECQRDVAGVSSHQWHECVSWLKRAKQITTQKTTRGNIIFVLNYDKYQTLGNYKTEAETEAETEAQPKHNRSTTEAQPKHNRHCIQECKECKECKECNNVKGGGGVKAPTPAEVAREFFNSEEKQNNLAEQISEKKQIQGNLVLEEIKKFVSYWTELTKLGKQQRWELEPTFEIPRRLGNWFKNVNKFNSNNNQNKIQSL